MSPKQFRALLAQAGLSQAEAGKLIDLTVRQMNRYATGAAKVPLVVSYALRYAIEQRQKNSAK